MAKTYDLLPFPMPGETLDGATVVASVWYSDEGRRAEATVLRLHPASPFYSVGIIDLTRGEQDAWFDPPRVFPNIVPAVECYEQNGGDW